MSNLTSMSNTRQKVEGNVHNCYDIITKISLRHDSNQAFNQRYVCVYFAISAFSMNMNVEHEHLDLEGERCVCLCLCLYLVDVTICTCSSASQKLTHIIIVRYRFYIVLYLVFLLNICRYNVQYKFITLRRLPLFTLSSFKARRSEGLSKKKKAKVKSSTPSPPIML